MLRAGAPRRRALCFSLHFLHSSQVIALFSLIIDSDFDSLTVPNNVIQDSSMETKN